MSDVPEAAIRACGQCGWSGSTAGDECPDCGAEWFLASDGEVNGFSEE